MWHLNRSEFFIIDKQNKFKFFPCYFDSFGFDFVLIFRWIKNVHQIIFILRKFMLWCRSLFRILLSIVFTLLCICCLRSISSDVQFSLSFYFVSFVYFFLSNICLSSFLMLPWLESWTRYLWMFFFFLFIFCFFHFFFYFFSSSVWFRFIYLFNWFRLIFKF